MERALRMVYKNRSLPFPDLRRKDNSYPIHHRNNQSLAIELYIKLKTTSQIKFSKVKSHFQIKLSILILKIKIFYTAQCDFSST